MKSCVVLLLSMLVVALVPHANAAGKKNDKAVVSFHMQAGAKDNPKMIFPYVAHGKERFFKRMPDFRAKDIASFTPFESPHDATEYGVVFRLKKTAAERLRLLSTAGQGSWMASQINGRVLDCVYINAPVNDGVLVIWRGIAPGDIATLEKAFPRPKKKD